MHKGVPRRSVAQRIYRRYDPVPQLQFIALPRDGAMRGLQPDIERLRPLRCLEPVPDARLKVTSGAAPTASQSCFRRTPRVSSFGSCHTDHPSRCRVVPV
jgi:hypothetical protein